MSRPYLIYLSLTLKTLSVDMVVLGCVKAILDIFNLDLADTECRHGSSGLCQGHT